MNPIRTCLVTATLLPALFGQGPPVFLGDLNTQLPTTYEWGRLLAGGRDGTWTYFLSDDGGTQIRLWRTDGTQPGTTLIKEIAGSFGAAGTAEMTIVNGIVYFTADSDVAGIELWRSDGTTAGTFLLRDISPGPTGSSPAQLTRDARTSTPRLWFSAVDHGHGRELWTSDGTTAGTVLVGDVYAGLASGMTPNSGIALGTSGLSPGIHTVYFAADDGVHGSELWRYTGRDPVLHADIVPGATGSNPGSFANVGDNIMFVATTPSNGREPHVMTGSTPVLVDVLPGSGSGGISNVIAIAQPLGSAEFWFAAAFGSPGQLCRYRTATGTMQNIDFPGANDGPVPTAFGQSVLVIAGPSSNRQLWYVDRQSLATTLLPTTDAEPLGVYPMLGNPMRALVKCDSNSFFAGILWATSGTPASTVSVLGPTPTTGPTPLVPLPTGAALLDDGRVIDGVNPPVNLVPNLPGLTAGSAFHDPTEVTPGTIVFEANQSLYRSDGTAQGTVQLANVGMSSPTRHQDQVWFLASSQVWRTDATIAGTQQLALPITGTPHRLGSLGSWLLIGTAEGALFQPVTYRLYRTNGTAAGTTLLASSGPQTGTTGPEGFEVFDDIAYFAMPTAAAGRELWRTDGTVAGTFMLKDIAVGTASGLVEMPMRVPGSPYLVFTADDITHGRELWRTQGTTASTVLVKDINPGQAPSWVELVADQHGKLLLIGADDGVHGKEPWTTDGTAANTVMLADAEPGSFGSGVLPIGRLGARRLFLAANAGHTRVMSSSGTPATTVVLGTFPYASLLRNGAQAGNRFVYALPDGSPAGMRPYATDGTVAGTQLLADIPVDGLLPPFSVGEAGKVIFSASQFPHGRELWISNGTSAGTAMHAELRPLLPGSSPQRLLASGSKIFFSADDGLRGRELYAMNSMAYVMPIGNGCTGTGGSVPLLDHSTLPVLGTPFTVELQRARASSLFGLVVGFGPGNSPLGGGCTALWSQTAPSVVFTGFTDVRGSASYGLLLPYSPVYEGALLFLQAAVLDPAGAFGNVASFSQGLQVAVGRP